MKIGRNDYGSSDSAPRGMPEDGEIYEGVIGGVFDCGWQPGRAPKPPSKVVCVAVELEWTDRTGRREVLFEKMRLSLWSNAEGTKKAALRSLFDVAFPDRDNSEGDTDDLVGRPVRVLVKHSAKGEKVYCNVGSWLRSKKALGAPNREYTQPFGLWKYLLGQRMTEAQAKAEIARLRASEGGADKAPPAREIIEDSDGNPRYKDTGEEVF